MSRPATQDGTADDRHVLEALVEHLGELGLVLRASSSDAALRPRRSAGGSTSPTAPMPMPRKPRRAGERQPEHDVGGARAVDRLEVDEHVSRSQNRPCTRPRAGTWLRPWRSARRSFGFGSPRGPGGTGSIGSRGDTIRSSWPTNLRGRSPRSALLGRRHLARAPIQTAAITQTPIPTSQPTRPSGTGPIRPSAAPPGSACERKRGDVVDDVALLVRGQRLVTEDRHVRGTGDHRFVDVLGRRVS